MFELSSKSPAAAFVPAAADTVTVVAAPDAASSSAVTVADVCVPLSSIVVRDRISVTAGASSSSVIVPVPVSIEIVPLVARFSATTSVSSGSSVASPCTITSKLFSVSPASNVKVASGNEE